MYNDPSGFKISDLGQLTLALVRFIWGYFGLKR